MLKEPLRRIKIEWVLTVAFCASLVFNLIPWLRGDVPGLNDIQKWVWPYSAPRWLWVIPCILGLALYVIGVLHLLDRRAAHEQEARYPRRLILWAFGGAVLLPLLLMTLEGRPLFLLFSRSASTVIGGYQFSTNMITDLGDTLRHWPQFVVDYRRIVPLGGIALSPPGLAALYYGVAKGFEAIPPLASTFDALVRPLQCQNFNMTLWSDAQMASAWFQMAMPLWAALAVAPLYALGAAMFERRVASWAVALWPLVPGMDIFMPRFNVWYPLIALVILVILWRGLTRPRWQSGLLYVGIAGFLLSVGLFMNLSLMPLGLLSGLIMLGRWSFGPSPRTQFARLVANLVVFGIACASVGVIYTVLSGVSILTVMQQGFAYHSILDRPYAPWLVLHTYDVFFWIGLPISILAIWRLVRIRRPVNPGDLLSGAMGLTLIIMVLSGTARGETGRVWLFFAGIWLLMAADMLVRLPSQERTALVVMQAMVVFSMAAVLRANFTELTVVPWPPVPAQGPTYATNVRFLQGSDAVTLSGLSVDKTPTSILLHLYWTTDAYVRRPYILTLVPVPPDKSARPSQNWVPVNQNYPPSCWLPKQTFVDDVTVPLGEKPQSGDWLFSLSIIDMFTRQPMIIDGQNATQFGIGPVNVSAVSGS